MLVKINNKNFLIIASLLILLTLSLGCEKYIYEPGRDTIEIFGDGTYQIYKIIDGKTLYDNRRMEDIEPYVSKYIINDPLVYLQGSKGFTILNYEKRVIKQNKNLNKFTPEEIMIFKQLK